MIDPSSNARRLCAAPAHPMSFEAGDVLRSEAGESPEPYVVEEGHAVVAGNPAARDWMLAEVTRRYANVAVAGGGTR